MKKLGLVGGLGPASTVDYYLGYIERVRGKFGESCYPEFVIDNVNMDKIISSIGANDYRLTAKLLLDSVFCLKRAGAQLAAITANTPHIAWDYIKNEFPIPVISIIDSALAEMKRKDYKRVVVFGTVFTMKSGLYEKPMLESGIFPIIPNDTDKELIGKLIYPNLENGIIIKEDREQMLSLAESYISKNNADAMLLGCTEIPLVIKEGDVSVPVLDTTQIHLDAIFKCAAE